MNIVDDMQLLSTHLDNAFLSSELSRSIRETVFFSGLMVSPRLVDQIAHEMSSSFFLYFEDRVDGTVRVYGGSLAHQGLGPTTVLTACKTLARVCREKSNPLKDLPEVAGSYTSALLEGYIEGREQKLLQEQERTLQAHLAAAVRQQRENDRPDS
jgi:hypothetical protein